MKNDAPNHPKMLDLAHRLEINQAWAIGIMEKLWHWTADFAPQGDIGKFTNTHIAKAVYWPGDPDKLITALVEVRWLDEHEDTAIRLIIHDWPDHCDDFVHKSLANKRRLFADGSRPGLTRLNHSERGPIIDDFEDAENPGQRGPIDIHNPPNPEQWEDFWALWPKYRKQNKDRALRAWCHVAKAPEVAREIIRGARIHLQPGGVLANPDPKYIPLAVTWLQNRRWNDEYHPMPNRPGKGQEETFIEREPTEADLMISFALGPIE